MTPSIDIIIVNYNSTDYLLECIDSIYRSLNGRCAHIFVEDNASIDGVDRINQQFPQVKVNINHTNIGFGAATNQAIKKGKSPYIVLINPDSKVEKGLFDTALDYLISHPKIGIIGPRIYDSDGGIQGSARSFPTPLTALFGRQSFFTRLFPHNRITRANLLANQNDGKTPMAVDWVSGACMLIKREAIDEVGLLDERFFMYWEDADWCHRMRKAGWNVVYFPLATVFHYVGKSSNKLLFRSIFEFHKSVYILFNKYYRGSLHFLKPLIIFGLFFRFAFVTISSKINVTLLTRKALRRTRKKPVFEKVYGRPISVLRMIARLNIGGPAIHVHLLNKKINPKKFKSTLVTGRISSLEGDMNYLFGSTEPRPLQIPELQRDISLVMDIRAFFRIFAILKERTPDIVHTHTAKAGFSARFTVIIYNLIFRRHVKLVHTFHGNVFEGYFNRFSSYSFILIERMIARFTDVIIAISESQKTDLINKYKIAPAGKLRTIRLGFDLLPFLKAGESKGKFKQLMGVDEKTVIIGIIGRLVAIKDHRMFLEVAQMLLARNPDLNVKFVIIGDGELRNDLKEYCRKLGLDPYVEFCGWIRNIPMVYADLDILVLTSQNEGTPVSIIEAMATGVPVIATDVGGVRDLLGEESTYSSGGHFCFCERGVLCRKSDIGGFVMALESLVNKLGLGKIEADEIDNKIVKLVERSRAFVVKEYSQDRLIKEIESLYEDLMASSTADIKTIYPVGLTQSN
jgi:GT2 family glycosyltransferase/glycogen synthase